MIQIDIVCPTYNNIEQVKNLFESLKNQKQIKINRVVFPLTLSNDISVNDQFHLFYKEKNITSFDVDKKDFSHSLTRQKAIVDYCQSDIVVLLSQDVVFKSSLSLYELAKTINDQIIYSYGRQICSNHSIEKYIREKNYPDKSYFIDSSAIEKMQIMAFFASDAFSALNRNKFIYLGGYRGFNVMMSEDMLYSKFVLESGYKKEYCAEAIVDHSHKYTLKQLYKRYYDTGRFYKTVKVFDSYKSNSSGAKLAFYILKKALLRFDIPVLLRWFPDMAVRYLGMKKGKR